VRKALALISFVFFLCLPVKAQTQQPIRVKCGGSAYTDSKGQAWVTDYDYSGGLVSQTTGSVSGTTDPALFQNGRMPDDTNPLVFPGAESRAYGAGVAAYTAHANAITTRGNAGLYPGAPAPAPAPSP